MTCWTCRSQPAVVEAVTAAGDDAWPVCGSCRRRGEADPRVTLRYRRPVGWRP